jgi:tRNA 2-thiocytidine biosynthesis protein TtcA
METAKKDKNTKLFLHLKKWLEKAVLDYNMIDEEDKLLIGVSGGADSMALLDLLDSPMLYIPHFSFVTVNIDLGFDPAYRAYNELEKYFQENGYRYVMEKTSIGPLSHSDFNKKIRVFYARGYDGEVFSKLPKLKVATK